MKYTLKTLIYWAALQLVFRAVGVDGNPHDEGFCPNGGIVDSSHSYCCPKSCGGCGGFGCHKWPGGDVNCCTSKITKSCESKTLPCIISDGGSPKSPHSKKCPKGSIVDASGVYCCPQSCGGCGGYGCDKFPGGDVYCCTSKITSSCSDGVLPCKISSLPTTGVCSNGGLEASIVVSGGCNIQVCCPASCSSCDASDVCTGPPECCAQSIASPVTVSDIDVSCRNHDPPCVVPPNPDPCTENPCQNGARCGYTWQGDFAYTDRCYSRVDCTCDELGGGYSGSYCEIKCGDGEAACGFYYWNYSTNVSEPNDICCSASEDCLKHTLKYGYVYTCYSKDRPTTCDPDPCLNGGTCSNVNYYGGDPIYTCTCADGFGGALCENSV